MQRFFKSTALLLVFLCALGAFGCSSGKKLNGDWKVDVDKQMSDGMFAKMPDEAKKKATEELGKMTFNFTDKTVSMKAGDKSEEAEFSVTKQDGDNWTVETKDKKGKAETATITWTDNTHIVMAPSGSPMKFYLVRAQ